MTKTEENINEEQNVNDENQDLKEELEENFVEEDAEYPHVIKNLENEVEELKDKLARSQADYKNSQVRFDNERAEMASFFTSKTAKAFFPSIDNFERIIKSATDEERETPLYKGLESTYKSMIKGLESLGISSFDSVWEEVDPERHEVMTQAPWKQDIIVEEFEKWYEMNGKVIRAAKVISWSWE